MSPAKKQPRAGAKPQVAKKPFAYASEADLSKLQPAWRFQLMDEEGNWVWDAVKGKTLGEIRGKLRNFESMRWGEIEGKGNKLIPTHKLANDAQKRLRALKLEDVDGLWELRLSGATRVWGIRESNLFYLLWWDPEHTVCPSNLR